jgi:hypothetical protein
LPKLATEFQSYAATGKDVSAFTPSEPFMTVKDGQVLVSITTSDPTDVVTSLSEIGSSEVPNSSPLTPTAYIPINAVSELANLPGVDRIDPVYKALPDTPADRIDNSIID